jgi:hypothetical protein
MATGLQPRHFTGENAALASDLAILPVKHRSLTLSMLSGLLESAGSRAIGIAGEYLDNYESPNPLALTAIALATTSLVLVIEITQDEDRGESDSGYGSDEEDTGFKEALAAVLQDPNRRLVAFNADRIALALYTSLDQRVDNLVDLQSSVQSTDDLPRNAPKAVIALLGGPDNVNTRLVHGLFANERHHETSFHKLAFRALSAFVAQYHNDLDEKIEELPKIDTVGLSTQVQFRLSYQAQTHRFRSSMSPEKYIATTVYWKP